MRKIIPILIIVLSNCGFAQIADTIFHEKMYIGTGEYNPFQNWHAILRFDDIMSYNGGPTCSTSYTPDGTIPIQQCFDDSVFLNFEHGLYLDESNDRMYVSTLFTNVNNVLTTDPDTAVGSVAIFDNISTLTGGQAPTRHIFGPLTQLRQPHGCWLDETRDMLYVANTFGENILVFHNASTRDGNTAPDRIIDWTTLGAPVYIFIDEAADRMFAACMPAGGGNPQICIYGSASTINGNIEPIVTIKGSNTRLGHRNPTVHNVWYNVNNGLLAVGHHTHELLIFDLNTINLNPGAPAVENMTPRIIQINENPSGLDTAEHNLYGFYWDEERDVMYVSDGISSMGPTPGSPPNVIKVYEGLSNPSASGIVPPSRFICWTNGDTYFPPQPIWVQKSMELIGIENESTFNFKLYPNPSTNYIQIELPDWAEDITVSIVDGLGKVVLSKYLTGMQTMIDVELLSPRVYTVKVEGFGQTKLMKQ